MIKYYKIKDYSKLKKFSQTSDGYDVYYYDGFTFADYGKWVSIIGVALQSKIPTRRFLNEGIIELAKEM